MNDLHGHEGGDGVLREVASIVKAGLRESDAVARSGGEELSILLREPSSTPQR